MAKKIIGLAVVALIVSGCFLLWKSKNIHVAQSIPSGQFAQKNITVGSITVATYIADTEAKRGRGLMEVKSLHENEGMIFLFDSTLQQSFWNKNTLLDLDIIWIAGENIVGVSKNLPPETGMNPLLYKIYYPPQAVDKVLEVNAGLTDTYGIAVGDTITFKGSAPISSQ